MPSLTAAFEDIPTKQSLFRRIDALARPGTLLATNTALSLQARARGCGLCDTLVWVIRLRSLQFAAKRSVATVGSWPSRTGREQQPQSQSVAGLSGQCASAWRAHMNPSLCPTLRPDKGASAALSTTVAGHRCR